MAAHLREGRPYRLGVCDCRVNCPWHGQAQTRSARKNAGPSEEGTAAESQYCNERLGVGLGLAKTEYPVALLPLATAFENFDALETLENVPLRRDGAGTFETAMLRHSFGKEAWTLPPEFKGARPILL